jgi:hypothetical protein
MVFADPKAEPQGLKPAFMGASGGTTEVVPFPKSIYETSSKLITILRRK